MWTYQAYVALRLAEERSREADNQRLANLARAARPPSRRSIRRSIAVGFASISSVTASATRRLDECVANDLAERLGPNGLAAGN